MGGVEEVNRREMDYLITIFRGLRERGYARHREIVEELGVSRPTASLMVKKLVEKGLVASAGRELKLTEKGEEAVAEILWRHGVLETALVLLGVSLEEACRIAWEIELILPENTVESIWRNLGMPSKCPCGLKFPLRWASVSLEDYPVCLASKARRHERP